MRTLLFIALLLSGLTAKAQCGPFTITGDTSVAIVPRTYDLSDTTHYNAIILTGVDTSGGGIRGYCHLRSAGGAIYPFEPNFSIYDKQQYVINGLSYLFCKVSMIMALPINN